MKKIEEAQHQQPQQPQQRQQAGIKQRPPGFHRGAICFGLKLKRRGFQRKYVEKLKALDCPVKA